MMVTFPAPLLLLAAAFAVCPAPSSGEAPPTINPANQQAVRSLESRLRREFRSTIFTIVSCQNCANNGTVGAILDESRVSRIVAPNVACEAHPGYSFSCSLTRGSIQIDGRWFVGEYTWRIGEGRRLGTPFARGRYTLQVRRYNPTWTGNFTRSEGNRISGSRGGPGFVNTGINMPCSRTDPEPPGSDFAFGFTRTSGSETPELSPLIERMARQVAADYFCDQMQGARTGTYFMNLGDRLQQQMTWQATAPSTSWIA